MTERTLKTGDRAKRPQRVPIGKTRNLITVDNQDPNFVHRIVKDKPGRIDRFLEAGYEVVTGNVKVGDGSSSKDISEGSPVKVNLGRGDTGYLMRIPKEFYAEDQAAKENEIQEREADMVNSAKKDTYGKLDIQRAR